MHTSAKYQNIRVQFSVLVAAVACMGSLVASPSVAQTSSSGAEQFVLKADGSMSPVGGTSQGAAAATPKAAPTVVKPATNTAPNNAASPVASQAASSVTNPVTNPKDTIAASDNTPAAKAVAAARQALNSKQFGQLASFVPQARGDVLATYPEYWFLRTQLGLYKTPGVAQSLEQFLEKNNGAYLADRLRGEWLLTAARSGDFVTVRSLG
ncbi:MAG: hypothetical protein WAO73_14225, partial [Zwartia sp.]